MKILDDYQEEIIKEARDVLRTDQTVFIQSETGSGKTVVFSTISDRFINSNLRDVIILTHSGEILGKTRETVFDWYGHISTKIDANTTNIQSSRIYIAMVETFDRRSENSYFMSHFTNVGMVIIDEAHLENFKKILKHFPTAKILAFSATPIAANKKDPLINHYKKIIVGPPVKKLIEINKLNPARGLVPCIEWSLSKVDRKGLPIKGDKFDEDAMGKEFSKDPLIQNTLNGYVKHLKNEKTLCFNSNREHSIKMHKAFLEAGFNSRHLDANKSGEFGNDSYRRDTFRWFTNEPTAILNNIRIATTGNDITSIKGIINNSAMLSMPLFRQKRGRGGRTHHYGNGVYKTHFVHLDMGDNILGGGFGEWDDFIDWKFIFENPKMPLPSIGTAKSCPDCGALVHISARVCTALKEEEDFFTRQMIEIECGHIFNTEEKKEPEEIPRELILITDGIKVKEAIEFFKDKHPFVAMHELYKQIANKLKTEIEGIYLDGEQLVNVYDITYRKITEWYRLTKNRKTPDFKDRCKDKIIEALKNIGFIVEIEELEILNEHIEQLKEKKNKGATV